MDLSYPITALPGTSTVTKNRLRSLRIETYFDLINYFPFRYEDYGAVTKISNIQEGETATVKGQIIKLSPVFTRSGLSIQKIELSDGTGTISVSWFNQRYLLKLLKPGIFLSVAGTVKKFGRTVQIEPKEYEVLPTLTSETVHTGRIIPIYSTTYGISTKTIREKIFHVLSHKLDIAEIYPPEIVQFNSLMERVRSYREVHFPTGLDEKDLARRRLAFDELFLIQLTNTKIREEWNDQKVSYLITLDRKNQSAIEEFIMSLPFILTGAQRRSVDEIVSDLTMEAPMNRFLQGDVGSGKTVVAALASYLVFLNGYKTLYMAPTEILASQHFQTFTRLFSTTGVEKISGTPPKCVLVTKNSKPKKGEIEDSNILIGTQALLNKNLDFERVALVVIDEQHRFGVAQRAALKEKAKNPHLLTMTATPIPRTVALTFFGELDMSVIDEMPEGRLPVRTFLVPKEKRSSGYLWMKEQMKKNKTQMFIICPLVEESDIETMQSVKAAKKEFEYLKDSVFPEFKVGLIHGKLKSLEKEQTMQKFKEHKLDILVATSVVEVGIDVPNAAIMLIEGADRYGLAQLHQLRGRVGRGGKQSYCFLYSDTQNEKTVSRLEFFCKNHTGIKLSEYDYKTRGPGDIFGLKQHGYLDLKIASLYDTELIVKTKNAVNYFEKHYKDLKSFTELKKMLDNYETRNVSRD